jgi:hypothetical protein
VERAVQYVRGNFFAGEHFTGLADAQAAAEAWCRNVAGMRIHGTIAACPAQVSFRAGGRGVAAAFPALCMPVFATVKVHRDLHAEIGRALYSAPKEYLGCHLDARADTALVKLFHHGVLGAAKNRPSATRTTASPLTHRTETTMITHDARWPLPRGNTPVPSPWQATIAYRVTTRPSPTVTETAPVLGRHVSRRRPNPGHWL